MKRDSTRQRTGHQLSSRMARRLLALAAQLGADAGALCRKHGLDPARLEDPLGRVSQDQVFDYLEALLETTSPVALGLLLASVAEPDAYHTPALILMASDRLDEGFERAFAHQRLWGDGDRFALVNARELGSEEQALAVTFRNPGPRRPASSVVEVCALAETLLAARALTGRFETQPLAVGLPGLTVDVARAAEHFGVAPETETEVAFLVLSNDVMQSPLPNANALFLSIFVRQAQQELERLPPDQDWLRRAREELLRGLTAGNHSLDRCAASLGLGTRTLERRLAEQGSSYARLLDQVRREQAVRLLGEPRSIDEIALLLGYSERSALHRACRRWFGCGPARLRKRTTGA